MPFAPPNAENLSLGRGELYFDRFSAAGAETGLLHLGNVDSFEITTEDEKLRKVEMMSGQANVYKEVTQRRNVALRVTATEFHADNVALMLMGEKAAYTQAATPIVDEIVKAGVTLGAYYKLALLGPYTGFTLEKDGSPDVLLVENTDYKIVDTTLGIVQLLTTAVNIAGGDTLLANYTPTAYTATAGLTRIAGGKTNNILGKVLFRPAPAAGPKLMVEVWRVSVQPDGAFGLISEEWGSFQLMMTVLDDTTNHPTEPLYRVSEVP